MNMDRRLFLNGLGGLAAGLMVAGGSVALAQDKDLSVEATGKPSRPAHARRMQASLTAIGSSRLSIGAPIRFQVRANQSGYGHVYIVNTSGSVVLLAENVRLKANVPVDVPRAGLTIRASAPAGTSEVLFLATRDMFNGFSGGQTTTTPSELQTSGPTLQQELQGRLSAASRHRWDMARIKVRVTN